MIWLIAASVFLVAYVLRVGSHWLAPRGLGVDHWFWKSYVETYRRERRFPPDLPQYILDAALLAVLWSLEPWGAWWGWVIVALLGGLILLTHKMTTQLFWFLTVATGLLYRRWELIAMVPASMAFATILSRGFYRKVLIA